MVNFLGKVAVKIFITDEQNNLLVINSAQYEDHEVPGGRIDEGESLTEAISREVKEELDLNIEIKDFKILNTFQAINPHENLNHLYLIININISNEEKIKIKTSEEAENIIWINKDNYQNYSYKKFLEKDIIQFVTNNNYLEQKFEFTNYEKVCAFVSEVQKLIVEKNHHPEITFGYNWVVIKSSTHDAGDIVTDKDMDLIQAINIIYQNHA